MAMTEEQERNAEVLRRMFAAFERKDYEEADRHLTEDNLIRGSTSPDAGLTDGTMLGRATMLDREFDEWRVHLLDVLPTPDGSSLVAVMSSYMRRAGVTSGSATLSGGVYQFRDGLICAVRAFPDVETALRTAGLDPASVRFSFDAPDGAA